MNRDPQASSWVRVWDPIVRIGHWVLVGGFTIAYLTEGDPIGVHSWAGYAVAIVVAIRVGWGFVGPRHARFASFVTGPGRVFGYLKDLVLGRAERHLGHSPAGGAMTVALLIALATTAGSGMALLAAEEGRGPLAGFAATVTQAQSPSWPVSEVMTERSPLLMTVDWDRDDDRDDRDDRALSQGHGGAAGQGRVFGIGGEALEEVHEIASSATLVLVLVHLAGVLVASLAHRENLSRAMITGKKRV